MQLFGIISLMLVLGLALWWMAGFGWFSVAPNDNSHASTSSETRVNYSDALDGAREAAEVIGD